MREPRNINWKRIDIQNDLLTNFDQPKIPENFFRSLEGLRNSTPGVVAERDFGTAQKFPDYPADMRIIKSSFLFDPVDRKYHYLLFCVDGADQSRLFVHDNTWQEIVPDIVEWESSNGPNPHVEILAIDAQRKFNIAYGSDRSRNQRRSIQIMKRNPFTQIGVEYPQGWYASRHELINKFEQEGTSESPIVLSHVFPAGFATSMIDLGVKTSPHLEIVPFFNHSPQPLELVIGFVEREPESWWKFWSSPWYFPLFGSERSSPYIDSVPAGEGRFIYVVLDGDPATPGKYNVDCKISVSMFGGDEERFIRLEGAWLKTE